MIYSVLLMQYQDQDNLDAIIFLISNQANRKDEISG